MPDFLAIAAGLGCVYPALPAFCPGLEWGGHLVSVCRKSCTVCISDPTLNGFGSACEAVHLLSDKTQLWSGQNFSDGQIII